MKCPYCGHSSTKVIDSRPLSQGNSTKRRRECDECGKRFNTNERVVDLDLVVIKRNGEKQNYSREKVLRGLTRALEKRNVDFFRVEESIDKIERIILNEYKGEIKASDLGNIIMSILLELDEIAYIRFASVYKKFDNLDNFIREIANIKNIKKN